MRRSRVVERSPGHRDWLAAEATIGRGRAVERAAERLPPRLGVLLRAIAALDDGRLDQVRAAAKAAEQAGHPDVAMVLDLLTQGSGVDPTQARKAAKKAGVDKHSNIEILDLIRLLATWRRGDAGPRAATLREAGRTRPALEAVSRALASKADIVRVHDGLVARLPRADQVCVALQGVALGHKLTTEWQGYFHDDLLLDVSSGRYAPVAADPDASLRSMLAGRRPWPEPASDVALSLERWIGGLPSAQRRAWIGALVRHVGDAVSQGRLHVDLIVPIVIARKVAELEPALSMLALQLYTLGLKLQWATEGGVIPEPLLEALFRERSRLGPEATRQIVEALAEADLEFVDPGVAEEAGLMRVARAADTPGLMGALEALGEELPPRWPERLAALGATQARIEEVRALNLLAAGRHEAALDRVPALIRSGAAVIAGEVAYIVCVEVEHTRLSRKARDAALRALLSAPPRPELVRAVVGLCADPALRSPEVLAWASGGQDENGEDPARRGVALALAARLGVADLAAAHCREEGRILRRLDGEAGDDRALGVISACFNTLGASGEIALPAVEPLARYLLREGPARAVDALRRLSREGREIEGAAAWVLWARPGLPQPALWREWLLDLLMPPISGLPPGLARLVRDQLGQGLDAALATRPRSLEELTRQVLSRAASPLLRMFAPDSEIPY